MAHLFGFGQAGLRTEHAGVGEILFIEILDHQPARHPSQWLNAIVRLREAERQGAAQRCQSLRAAPGRVSAVSAPPRFPKWIPRLSPLISCYARMQRVGFQFMLASHDTSISVNKRQ